MYGKSPCGVCLIVMLMMILWRGGHRINFVLVVGGDLVACISSLFLALIFLRCQAIL